MVEPGRDLVFEDQRDVIDRRVFTSIADLVRKIKNTSRPMVNQPSRSGRCMQKRDVGSSDLLWPGKHIDKSTDTMPDDDIATDIIDILFRPGEEAIFIDETVSIEEIAHNRVKFLCSASQYFGMALRQEHLAMTVPELAAHIRSVRNAIAIVQRALPQALLTSRRTVMF
ncbi:MAG TPA: hypothetical protein VHZ55_19680 [Bryobacteraceae bacterium]|nr:hypothetical protein [Bryobacteraceae bacterium]